MPTYQYRCAQCATDLEVTQRFDDPPLDTCPQCSGELRKVFSAVGVVFKGSGFYATDSRKRPSDTNTPKTKVKSDSAASGSVSSDSKPEKSSKPNSPVDN